MPGVSLVGADTAGGTILGGGQSFVVAEGDYVSLVGDGVAAHAPCPIVPIHCSAVMAEGSSVFYIDGIPVCRAGDSATCSHPATGQSWFYSD